MIDNNTTIQPAKVRVSIFERIVPFAAMALAAIGGAVGGYLIIFMMNILKTNENAGIGAVSGALAEYTTYQLIFFYASSLIGLIAVAVAVGRLMIESKTSSPSGLSYLALVILALLPVGLVWHAGGLIISVLNGTSQYNIGMIGASIADYSWVSVIITPIIIFVLLAWSLIPFKAVPGRRFGPLIAVVIVEIMLVTVTIAFQLRVFELYRINRTLG
jgi:hypothetical protein